MKETPHFSWLRFLPSLVFLCSITACSSSNGVDDYYTFNVVKSESISVSPQVPVEQDISASLPITIDSIDLITSTTLRTTIPLTKSVKLTKLAFAPGDISYPMTSFDTLMLSVSADSLPDELLATYSGASDSVYYTNADFGNYLQSSSSHFSVTFRANKAPAQAVNIAASYTLVFTSKPLQ